MRFLICISQITSKLESHEMFALLNFSIAYNLIFPHTSQHSFFLLYTNESFNVDTCTQEQVSSIHSTHITI